MVYVKQRPWFGYSSPVGIPCGIAGREPSCQCRSLKGCRLSPWVGKIPWRRAWQPTPVFLPGESHGQRSLAGYSPWGHTESDTTERLSIHAHLYCSRTLQGLAADFIQPPPPRGHKFALAVLGMFSHGLKASFRDKLLLLLWPKSRWRPLPPREPLLKLSGRGTHFTSKYYSASVLCDWFCSGFTVRLILNPLSWSNPVTTSVQFSCSVVSDSLRPHELQHTRLPCPSPTLRAYSNSGPLSR